MKFQTSKLLILGLILVLLTGCVSEYYKPLPADCDSVKLTPTKTIADIYAIAIDATGNPANSPVYAGDDIIEGYVVSSDEGGNFYQSMYIQPLDKSKGFNFSVNIKSAYMKKFDPGTKVYLKLKGLAYSNPTTFASGLIFGAKATDKYAVDRFENFETNLISSCDVVSEDLLVNKITIAQAIANNNIYLNTLVEIDNVQFTDATAGGTYDSNLTNTFDDNTFITSDALSTTRLAVRTSRYANFASNTTPTRNGKIRGVLTKYVSSSGVVSYQVVIRTLRDVQMTKPRLLPPSAPQGGSALVYGGIVTEPFTGFTVNQTSFPSYINDKIIGTRYWALKQFPTGTGNKYIEMSSYNGSTSPGAPATSYFMVPVDFTAASSFSFKKLVRFNRGTCLNVYYIKSSDFTAGTLNPYLFTDITSSFNLTYPAIGGIESAFTSSGTYNIDPSLTGTGFFIFEYVGSTTVTTTMQIDDIVIN